MAIDYKTPIGQVRLLSADLAEGTGRLLNDDQLNGLLAMHDNNVLRAAADALDTVATTESLVSKKIRTQDLSTDGPAVATDLRKRAGELRARADAQDPVVQAEEEGGFEVIPMHPYPRHELEERRW